ncbi:hypothetical protein SK128_027822 [Halocaridina rubra]|uniref:Small ribosomal subunit protein uS12m n=1 Tax=Halocaridina rubra TaxID=373956 RepID=A0AAN8WEF8_HALRR
MMLGMKTLQCAFSRLGLVPPLHPKYVTGTALKYLSPLAVISSSRSVSNTSLYSYTVSSNTFSLVSSVTLFPPRIMSFTPIVPPGVKEFSTSSVRLKSLYQMHRTGPVIKKRKKKNPLGGKPMARGVVLKTLIKKPRKPNSANRKCVLVKLSTGKEMVAYVPGEGHNLQEHNIVLVRPGRLRDVPGVKLKCIRGKYDLAHVMKHKAI